MRHFIGVAIAVVALLTIFAVPAGAHVKVNEHGHGAEWVGSPPEGIPGQGKGLVQGGPTGETTLSPSHAKGLVTACEQQKDNPSAVQFFGPPFPDTCVHGGP